ncbi:hypothetical protein [Sorangium sp. So ce131]|uniref:hypothetical protein n=1 Tax=Sorangium sp. So ce131 TaxID=3133282 RepID=UPI003F5DC742
MLGAVEGLYETARSTAEDMLTNTLYMMPIGIPLAANNIGQAVVEIKRETEEKGGGVLDLLETLNERYNPLVSLTRNAVEAVEAYEDQDARKLGNRTLKLGIQLLGVAAILRGSCDLIHEVKEYGAGSSWATGECKTSLADFSMRTATWYRKPILTFSSKPTSPTQANNASTSSRTGEIPREVRPSRKSSLALRVRLRAQEGRPRLRLRRGCSGIDRSWKMEEGRPISTEGY